MNKEEITEILDKLSNRKQETLLQGLRECQLKNIEHVFITREEYIDKVLNYINDLQQQNQKYKEVIDKAINNSQYWIDYYTRLNSDERIALRLQENIDILKEVE